MVIKLCVVQFWSEIIFVISNRTCAACSFDFKNYAYDFRPNCSRLISITIINRLSAHHCAMYVKMCCSCLLQVVQTLHNVGDYFHSFSHQSHDTDKW